MAKKIYTYQIDYDYKRTHKESDKLEVIVNGDGKYTVSVIGARGAVRSIRHDFNDILSRGWLYDKLTALSAFRWMLAELGVNMYAYTENRYYYA